MTTDETLPFITAVADRYYHRNAPALTCPRQREDSDYWGNSLGQLQVAGFLRCEACCPDERIAERAQWHLNRHFVSKEQADILKAGGYIAPEAIRLYSYGDLGDDRDRFVACDLWLGETW